jgi:hypothetical protein
MAIGVPNRSRRGLKKGNRELKQDVSPIKKRNVSRQQFVSSEKLTAKNAENAKKY